MQLLRFVLVCVCVLVGTLVCRAQVDTLYVSQEHVVHLVMTSEITDVEVSNEEKVYVRVMDNNPNIAGLLAFEPFVGVTSLMLVDAERNVHVYYLAYREDPSELVHFAGGSRPKADVSAASGVYSGSLMDHPEEFNSSDSLVVRAGEFRRGLITHVGQRNFGVGIVCDRLYVDGDRIVVRFKITNNSPLSYSFGNVVFQVERPGGSGGRVKKTKLQEGKSPVAAEVHSLVPAGETSYSCFVFDKFSLRRQEEFQVFFNEDVDTGTRAFELVFTADDINKAVRRR